MTIYRLGLTPVGKSRYPSPWFAQVSVVFVCPICGSSWGSVEDQGEWVPIRAGCPLHPWPYQHIPGGTFIPPWPLRSDQWAFFPREVLAREWALHFNYSTQHGNLSS